MATKDLNKVQLTGNLGGDPEMRYTPQGSAVTTFSVASGRTWRDRDGSQHEATEWFRIVAWDKLGEICNQYLTKGTRVYIEGRLQTRKFTDRDGLERTITEVIAQDMIILSARGERAPGADSDIDYGADTEAAPARRAPTPAPAARPAPPARQPQAPAPAARAPRNHPQPVDMHDDDDIPF